MSDADLLVATQTDVLVVDGAGVPDVLVYEGQDTLVTVQDPQDGAADQSVQVLIVELEAAPQVIERDGDTMVLTVGEPGPGGPKGDTGQGTKGDKGDTGATGPAGAAGFSTLFFVADGQTMVVADDNQVLSAVPVTLDGTLQIDNGFFVELL